MPLLLLEGSHGFGQKKKEKEKKKKRIRVLEERQERDFGNHKSVVGDRHKERNFESRLLSMLEEMFE